MQGETEVHGAALIEWRALVLKYGYLCLLETGTSLFRTSSPSWRQQPLLATM
jgi:hypothetical protein